MSLVQSNYWMQLVLNTLIVGDGGISSLLVRLFSNSVTLDISDPLSAFTECSFPGYAPVPMGSFGAASFNGTVWQLIGTSALVYTTTGAGPYDVYGYYVTDTRNLNWYWGELAPSGPIVLGSSNPSLAVLPTFAYTNIP